MCKVLVYSVPVVATQWAWTPKCIDAKWAWTLNGPGRQVGTWCIMKILEPPRGTTARDELRHPILVVRVPFWLLFGCFKNAVTKVF